MRIRLWRKDGGLTVEAIRANTQNVQEVIGFCAPIPVALSDDGLVIKHDWGSELVRWGAMILRNAAGRLSTCDAEVFFSTYEPVCDEVYP